MSKRARLIWGIGLAAVLLIVLLVAAGVEVFRTESLMKRFGPPPPTGQDCGKLVQAEELPPARTVRADASIQTLTCFWNAYQSCRAATMSQTLAGVDAGSTKTITVERRSNHCAIYGQAEGYTNTEHSTVIFLCNHLNQAGETLQLSDCDNTEPFALAPRDITRVYHWCGAVGGGYPPLPQQVEDCFFYAYQNCWDDAMVYVTLQDAPPPAGELEFIIDNHCGIAYLHNSYTTIAPLAACASLEQRADGLHFMQCGADGDIFVPSAPLGSTP